MGSIGGKCNLQHSMAHPRNPLPYRRKNLADTCIFYTDRVIANFVPNFVVMATGVGQGKYDWQHSMAHFRKPSYKRKNLSDISYTRRVIANFVQNLVAMATGVDRGKNDLQHCPSPKTPLQTQKSRRYLLHKPSYSTFCPKFRCHGNQGRSGVKLNDTIRLAYVVGQSLPRKLRVTLPVCRPEGLKMTTYLEFLRPFCLFTIHLLR